MARSLLPWADEVLMSVIASVLFAALATGAELMELPDHQLLQVNAERQGWALLTDDQSKIWSIRQRRWLCSNTPKRHASEIGLADGQLFYGEPERWNRGNLVVDVRCGEVRVPVESLSAESFIDVQRAAGPSPDPHPAIPQKGSTDVAAAYAIARGPRPRTPGKTAAAAVGLSTLIVAGFSVGVAAVYTDGFKR